MRSPHRGVDARRAWATFVPALVLAWLGLSQVVVVVRGLAVLSANPSWTVASEITRSALYATFVIGAVVILLSSKGPRARDHRRVAVATSLTATFLMLGLSFLPAGPALWGASSKVDQVGLALTVVGAALALTSFLCLGANSSIAAEARELVVTGPYRVLRHPIYAAELMMIAGVVVAYPRLSTLLGALAVMGLQIYRIQTEERLLRDNFAASFADFAERTRYRLVPLLW